MRIVQHKPVARGVSQLMYVGDDQAVEGGRAAWPWPVTLALVGLGLWILCRK